MLSVTSKMTRKGTFFTSGSIHLTDGDKNKLRDQNMHERRAISNATIFVKF